MHAMQTFTETIYIYIIKNLRLQITRSIYSMKSNESVRKANVATHLTKRISPTIPLINKLNFVTRHNCMLFQSS